MPPISPKHHVETSKYSVLPRKKSKYAINGSRCQVLVIIHRNVFIHNHSMIKRYSVSMINFTSVYTSVSLLQNQIFPQRYIEGEKPSELEPPSSETCLQMQRSRVGLDSLAKTGSRRGHWPVNWEQAYFMVRTEIYFENYKHSCMFGRSLFKAEAFFQKVGTRFDFTESVSSTMTALASSVPCFKSGNQGGNRFQIGKILKTCARVV